MADKNIAKKEKAIEIMKKMDIYKPYIKASAKATKFASLKGSAVSGSTKNLNFIKR